MHYDPREPETQAAEAARSRPAAASVGAEARGCALKPAGVRAGEERSWGEAEGVRHAVRGKAEPTRRCLLQFCP